MRTMLTATALLMSLTTQTGAEKYFGQNAQNIIQEGKTIVREGNWPYYKWLITKDKEFYMCAFKTEQVIWDSEKFQIICWNIN